MVFKFYTFWELIMFLDISSVFYRIPIWLFFTIIVTIHLLISLGTLLAGPLINLLFVWSYLIKYAHNSIISDFSIFGIQIGIFTDIPVIFKFITSEATCMFWKLNFLFFIINIKFVHQIHIRRILMRLLRSSLGLIPVVIDCYTVLSEY